MYRFITGGVFLFQYENHLSNYGQTYFERTWFLEQIRDSETKLGQEEKYFLEVEISFWAKKPIFMHSVVFSDEIRFALTQTAVFEIGVNVVSIISHSLLF